MHTPDSQTRSLPFTTHIGDPESLWTDPPRTTDPVHLVITAVRLHKRNVETQLREHAQPLSSFSFERLHGLAEELLQAAKRPTTAIDRVDRLAALREILADTDAAVYDQLAAVVGEPLARHVEEVERARNELELVTGFHPARMETFADALRSDDEGPPEMASIDTLDLLAGVAHLHRDLETWLDDTADTTTATPTRAISETALLARATRSVHADPAVWTAAYPSIERLSIVGTSMLTAPLEDCCRVIATQTDVDVHLHLRPGGGRAIAEHLAHTDAVENPGAQGVWAWR